MKNFFRIRRHIFQGNISDKNLEYRQDYLQILKNLGFNARDDKVVAVYFSCRIPDLLYLYSISAFKGTGNWERLLKAIGMITTRKTSYGRSLFRLTEFSDNPLRANPVYTKENFRQWIYRMSKNGYIEKDGITLTAKAHNLIEIFNRWKNDFKTLET